MDSRVGFPVRLHVLFENWGWRLCSLYKPLMGFALAMGLGACGDPLAGIERLSDVAVVDTTDPVTALPTAQETADTRPVLTQLMNPAEPVATQTQPQVAEPKRGLFARLLPSAATKPATAPEKTSADVPAPQAVAASATSEPVPTKKGLFGRLLPAVAAPSTGVQTASLGPDALGADKRGLFAKSSPRDRAPIVDVQYGAVLPFGQLGRVCEANRRELGRKITSYPDRGRGYALYDSHPGSAVAHTFYITGFADNCPRQFTAALALFGEVGMYEQLRYSGHGKGQRASATDKAYETIKRQVCGVGKGKPCGKRIGNLQKTTVFLSAYEHFGDGARWTDMLIHDGTIAAAALNQN